MPGETNLSTLLKTMQPKLNNGAFVFCTIPGLSAVQAEDALMLFREEEAITLVLTKEKADAYGFPYASVFSWITLTVHSSLDAVGLTATFSKALAEQNISCNVVAAFYHDHIFVTIKDAAKAMEVLKSLSNED